MTVPFLPEPGILALGAAATFVSAAAKTGSGVPVSILPVLVLSLQLDPAQAVALATPAACAADWAAARTCRRSLDPGLALRALPWMLAGCGLGVLTVQAAPPGPTRLLVACLALLTLAAATLPRPAAPAAGGAPGPAVLWATLAGFGSAVGHAGGPFLALWLLPQGLGKLAYIGTAVGLWAVVNHLKLALFAAAGLLGPAEMPAALLLAAAAWVGGRAGLLVVGAIPPARFAGLCRGMVVLASLAVLLASLPGR